MAQQELMTLKRFQEKFHSDDACREHLFQIRWTNGFCCPKCKHHAFYFLETRKLYQCTSCKHQASVTAGTIMQKSRTPLLTWFWAIFLVAHDKRGISAVFLSRELEISYPTAWLLLHKIRKAMGDRDAHYQLAGLVELDDAFFGAPTEGGKRGRGTDQTPVLVGVSLNKQGAPQYVKMQVIPNVKGKTLVEFAKQHIEPGSTISSDAYRSYNALAEEYHHQPIKFNVKDNPDHLKWLHTMISNAKAFIGGTFHGLDAKHLQSYLNEFCFRTNRRQFEGQMFNRLLAACVATDTVTYFELTA
ncbi:IS1595 family transposase [Paenibacillus koleovorans]|uniref:IS1595 family transposase n=1 Tax=Paenibacillus koleovorans TaxID=121608 RepID=UPI000FDB1DD3|nr:IS1595 family transposase [Paenibacillus koleovorans]